MVLKEPFGFSIFDRDHAASILQNHPEVEHWAVGGHSLGGTVAASFAEGDRRVEGLLLLASYPAGKIERTDLRVTSVSGDRDGLATPAKIDASKANLPSTPPTSSSRGPRTPASAPTAASPGTGRDGRPGRGPGPGRRGGRRPAGRHHAQDQVSGRLPARRSLDSRP